MCACLQHYELVWNIVHDLHIHKYIWVNEHYFLKFAQFSILLKSNTKTSQTLYNGKLINCTFPLFYTVFGLQGGEIWQRVIMSMQTKNEV